MSRLNFPLGVGADFKGVLDSAVYWTQIDFNEETKKEVEGLIVQDDFAEISKRFTTHLTFKEPGIISAKLGGGFSRVNFVTMQLLGHGIAEYLWDLV